MNRNFEGIIDCWFYKKILLLRFLLTCSSNMAIIIQIELKLCRSRLYRVFLRKKKEERWFIWFISNILFGHHGQSKLLFCFLWFLHCRSRVMGLEIVENCLLSIHLSININIYINLFFLLTSKTRYNIMW